MLKHRWYFRFFQMLDKVADGSVWYAQGSIAIVVDLITGHDLQMWFGLYLGCN